MTVEFTITNRKAPRFTADVVLDAYQVIQLRDGRAAFLELDVEADDSCQPIVSGVGDVAKASAVNLLDGCEVWWDDANAVATYKRVSKDCWYLGTANGDALAGATTVAVDINAKPKYECDLGDGLWTTEATNGLGVTQLPGGAVQLAFDAVVEAAQAAIFSTVPIAVAKNPIFEARIAVFDIGDDAALDMNIGLASGSHATDFQSVAEQATIHFNGADLSVFAESDDSATDVAEVDTTVNAVDDTDLVIWIDARVPAAVKFYVDGVRVLSGSTFTLAAAAGPLYAIAHIEKTSNDTLADLRVRSMRVRTGHQ